MKHAYFFNGEEVLKQDLDHFQDSKAESIEERLIDFFSDGIYDAQGSQSFLITVDGVTSTTVNVGTGVGYMDGERILIDSNRAFDATRPSQVLTYGDAPESTGNLSVPLVDYTNGVDNYFWIEYLNALDPSYVSADVWGGTGNKYTKYLDGYAITVDRHQPTIGISGSNIYLGKVTGAGVGVVIPSGNITQTGLSFGRLNLYSRDSKPVYGQSTTNKAGVYGNPIVQAEEMVYAPIVIGTTIGATTSIQSPLYAGNVTTPQVIASTSIQSPLYSNNVITPLLKSTGGIEGLTLVTTTSVQSATLYGTSLTCSPIVCATTCVASPYFYRASAAGKGACVISSDSIAVEGYGGACCAVYGCITANCTNGQLFPAGVVGCATGTCGIGVLGCGAWGNAFYGTAYGVYASTTTNDGFAVYGKFDNSGVKGIGVYGYSNGTSDFDETAGVLGCATAGNGVTGISDGATTAGVYGSNSGDGNGLQGGTAAADNNYGMFTADNISAANKAAFISDVFINDDSVNLKSGDVVKLNSEPKYFEPYKNPRIPVSGIVLSDTDDDIMTLSVVAEPGGPHPEMPEDERENSDNECTEIKPGGRVFVVTCGAFAHCKVDTSFGEIRVGDRLTSSSTKGCARKATLNDKYSFGRAMEYAESNSGIKYISIMVHMR